ncbi:hypothetical protein D3C77_559730 [compost metagenome]
MPLNRWSIPSNLPLIFPSSFSIKSSFCSLTFVPPFFQQTTVFIPLSYVSLLHSVYHIFRSASSHLCSSLMVKFNCSPSCRLIIKLRLFLEKYDFSKKCPHPQVDYCHIPYLFSPLTSGVCLDGCRSFQWKYIQCLSETDSIIIQSFRGNGKGAESKLLRKLSL